MAEGGKTNRSPNINWVIELWLGGEHSEGQEINPVRDVRKSALTDPGRSDAVHKCGIMELTLRQKSAGS